MVGYKNRNRSLKFVTKEAEKNLQKGFVLGNTQSTYTQTVPKVFSEWKLAQEDALDGACP